MGRKSATDAPYSTQNAFTRLYENTHRIVFRYVLGFTGNQHDAEDISAETYLKAWHKRENFKGDQGAALGWLLTIAKRLVIDQARKDQRRPEAVSVDDLKIVTGQTQPEQELISGETQEILWRLLAELPDEHREMIVLRYMLGWRVNEIAEHMQINPNTITVTLQRILKRLHADWLIKGGSHV